jgi:hypothetical protein
MLEPWGSKKHLPLGEGSSRDNFCCQYTGIKLQPSKRTVDHIIPKARGGKSTWENCVTSSFEINSIKSNRTPEEAGLKLLNKPCVPQDPLGLEFSSLLEINNEWIDYFPGVERNITID